MNTAPDGMMIYNSTDGFTYLRKTAAWQKITDATYNGGFALPYGGTVGTLGGTAFAITQTGGFGDGISVTNSGGGNAFLTHSGNNKLNTTIGNTGIGIPTGINDAPILGRLVVRNLVGNTSAVFGDKTTGVSIENNFPRIAFNAYYNGGSKNLADDFSARISHSPVDGKLFFHTTSSPGTAGNSNDSLQVNHMTIDAAGNVGLQGNSNLLAPLSFSSSMGNKIALYGDATGVHYGLGIQSGELQVYSDGPGSDVVLGYKGPAFTEKMRVKGDGTVGIGVTVPSDRLDVNGRMRLRKEGTFGSGIWMDGTTTLRNTFFGMFDNNNFGFYSNTSGWKHYFDAVDGTVRLGTTTKATGYLLNVGGKIISEEVRVQLQAAWPDYVFAGNYKLKSLDEVGKFISANKHLPGMPSAADIEKDGQMLGEVQRKLLEKVEELTLYVIDLKKEIEVLKKKN